MQVNTITIYNILQQDVTTMSVVLKCKVWYVIHNPQYSDCTEKI